MSVDDSSKCLNEIEPKKKKRLIIPSIKTKPLSEVTQAPNSPDEYKKAKRDTIGYALGLISFGLTVGVTFGGIAVNVTIPKYPDLVKQIDTLSNEIVKLKIEEEKWKDNSEKYAKSLDEVNSQLVDTQEKLSSTESQLAAVTHELDQKNINSVAASKADQTEINTEVELSENKTNSFYNGELYVSANEISVTNKVDITVGAPGFESVTKYGIKTGERFVFHGNHEYEVRLTKVSFTNETVAVMVKKLKK